jgi:hypothetical protein
MNENLYWIVPLIISVLGTILGYFFSFGKRANQLDTLLSDFKELKKKVEGISEDLIRLQVRIDICLPAKQSDLAKQKSPISLTEQGIVVKNKIKADEVFASHKEELYGLLDQTKLNNAYDIQIEAFRVIGKDFLKLLNEQETIALKNEAYLLGKQLEEFLVIFQILFRDDILKTKNIPVSDVDKHDPHRHV